HLLAERLTARDQLQQLAVQLGQGSAQFFQIHCTIGPIFAPATLLLAVDGYRKCSGTATIVYELEHETLLDGNVARSPAGQSAGTGVRMAESSADRRRTAQSRLHGAGH